MIHTDPEPYEEMAERIAYCRRMKRRSIKLAMRWRRLLRTSGKGMREFCQSNFRLAWQDVQYWVLSEQEARGIHATGAAEPRSQGRTSA